LSESVPARPPGLRTGGPIPAKAGVARAGVAPPPWADRFVGLATLVLLVGVGYSLWCQSPLIWDGAYQLAYTLKTGQTYAYLSRFHTHLVWKPVAWLAWHTDNVKLLTAVYGAPFLLAPAVGLTVSWWFVRRHAPLLIVWAALGTMATPLPGQIFVINDSIFQQHLFWPILLGLLVPLSKPKWAVLAFLSVFQWVHQIGVVLLVGLLAALLLAWFFEQDAPHRRRLLRHAGFALGLLAVSAFKTWWTSAPRPAFGGRFDYFDSYAAQEATWPRIRESWLYGVEGLPLQGLMLAYAASLLLFAQWVAARRGRWSAATVSAAAAGVCLIGSAALWGAWGSMPGFWSYSAINYRRWVVPLTLPMYALAVVEFMLRRRVPGAVAGSDDANAGAGASAEVDAGRPAPPPPRSTVATRGAVMVGLAVMFGVVLGMQSTQYKRYSDKLRAEVAASGHATLVLGPEHWMRVTPLWHWGTNWQVLLEQGRRPRKWIVGGDDAFGEQHLKQLDGGVPNPGDPPKLPVSSFTFEDAGPGPTGWFDLRDVIAGARRDRAAGLAGVAPPATRPTEGLTTQPRVPADGSTPGPGADDPSPVR
jgi:hypothetical protein